MNVRTVYHMADCTTELFMRIKLRNMNVRTVYHMADCTTALFMLIKLRNMNVRTVYHMADCTTALFMRIKLRNMRRTALYFLCKHCAMDTALSKMENKDQNVTTVPVLLVKTKQEL